MPIIPIHHYAMENHPTIFEEESLTALEMCARTTAKVNECIEHINKHDKHVGDQLKEQDEKINTMLKEDIQKHVDNWLDEHPEATTTVQPGSLTERHFRDDVIPQLKNSYVTPQMFGALGDGKSDDTYAFMEMLENYDMYEVFIPAGTYKITDSLPVRNSIRGEAGTVIQYYPSDDAGSVGCFNVNGSRETWCESSPCVVNGNTITVQGTTLCELKAGDFVYLVSQEKGSPYSRDYETKQDILEVESVSGTTITFTTMPEWQDMTEVKIHKLNLRENIEICNLTIECMSYSVGSIGIYMSHTHNANVHNCNVKNFDYSQIHFYCSVNAHAHDNYCAVNYFNDLQYGIYFAYVWNGVVHGNTVNSERTAIDITYGSMFVTVSGNSTKGNINTHWCVKCLIVGNTINDGEVLIRGKCITVANNVINQHNGDVSCIDIMEGGMEGGHVIEGNVCYGVITLKAVTSGCRIINNTFKATRCPLYYDTEASMIRISSAPNSKTHDEGCEISGNHLEYLGDVSIKYGIDMYYNTTMPCYNVRISNNVIKNVVLGINAISRGEPGKNLTISGNDIMNVVEGISFNKMDNTLINGNNIRASVIHEARYGIRRGSSTYDNRGLIITANMINGFPEGINITAGAGVIRDSVIADNCFVNCPTRHNITGTKAVPQVMEFPAILGQDGIRYELSVANGEVVATARSEV